MTKRGWQRRHIAILLAEYGCETLDELKELARSVKNGKLRRKLRDIGIDLSKEEDEE